MNRINDVRHAAATYGRRSVENMEICRKLGRKIIGAFDRYLTIEGDVAFGVPPSGAWDPEAGDYRDATFSFYGDGLLRLSDIQFGIAVRIDNLRDEGVCWRRIVVNLRKEGDKIGVFPDTQSDGVWIPVAYDAGNISEVCEALYRVLLNSFREDTQIFVEGNGRFGTIGFIGTIVR